MGREKLKWSQVAHHQLMSKPRTSFYRGVRRGGRGGGSGDSGEPPFKLIIFIAWLACMFSMQIVTAIQDTYLKFKFSLRLPQNIQLQQLRLTDVIQHLICLQEI